MDTFLCVKRVRGAKLAQFSDAYWGTIRRGRTNNVQKTMADAPKSLILKDSMTGTANALRPRLKPFP
jgi:hypothetical protein